VACLVTPSGEEKLPATRRSRPRLAAVLHARHEDEDDLLIVFFYEKVLGCALAVDWAAVVGSC
jgi:hypothetical protein